MDIVHPPSILLMLKKKMSESKNTLFTIAYILISVAVVFGIVSFTLDDFDWVGQFNKLCNYINNLINFN